MGKNPQQLGAQSAPAAWLNWAPVEVSSCQLIPMNHQPSGAGLEPLQLTRLGYPWPPQLHPARAQWHVDEGNGEPALLNHLWQEALSGDPPFLLQVHPESLGSSRLLLAPRLPASKSVGSRSICLVNLLAAMPFDLRVRCFDYRSSQQICHSIDRNQWWQCFQHLRVECIQSGTSPGACAVFSCLLITISTSGTNITAKEG